MHVVTVNDYLARRDAEWMGTLYKFLGLTVDTIQHDFTDADRQRAYRADVTYGTNNEFGFDYLRDNMKFDPSLFVHRIFPRTTKDRDGKEVEKLFNFAIVDEVDSILIDEARTPADHQRTGGGVDRPVLPDRPHHSQTPKRLRFHR